jgi:hypothetical protein
MGKNDKPLASELQRVFVQHTRHILSDQIVYHNNEKLVTLVEDTSDVYLSVNCSKAYRKEIDKGLRLGTFLYESGWFENSLQVLQMTRLLILEMDDNYGKLLLLLSCLQKLLHVQALFCCFKDASITTSQALSLIEQIHSLFKCDQIDQTTEQDNRSMTGGIPNSFLVNFYYELSTLHYSRSEYDLSYKWAVKALEYLSNDTPHKITVDALRQAAKSCVVKRKFQLANLLIESAVRIAE